MSRVRQSISRKLHTRQGKNLIVYAMCLIVSFVFWVFITLDEDVERDYLVNIQLENVPDSVVIIGNVPSTINTVIKGKGAQFLRYSISGVPQMKIDFRQYSNGRNLSLSRSKLDSRLRDIFGQNINIVSVSPDSVSVNYTDHPGKRLPLVLKADITPSVQSVISGIITTNIDSVSVYSVNGIPSGLSHIETELLTLTDISDTAVCEVKIRQIDGMRILPESVTVTVPVELLISKKRSVPVIAENMPENLRLITFPSNVEINCLVPMRLYNREVPMQAVIDYKKLTAGELRAKVRLSALPDSYKLVAVTPDSVDYYIETIKQDEPAGTFRLR